MQGGEGGKMTCSGRLRREGEKRKKGLVVWVFFFFFISWLEFSYL